MDSSTLKDFIHLAIAGALLALYFKEVKKNKRLKEKIYLTAEEMREATTIEEVLEVLDKAVPLHDEDFVTEDEMKQCFVLIEPSVTPERDREMQDKGYVKWRHNWYQHINED